MACEIMGRLKLTVNQEKTRICKGPEEEFDFLGYSLGQIPKYAPTSRDLRKPTGSSMATTKASAASCSTPGMVISPLASLRRAHETASIPSMGRRCRCGHLRWRSRRVLAGQRGSETKYAAFVLSQCLWQPYSPAMAAGSTGYMGMSHTIQQYFLRGAE